jgi:hypothetical protein
MIIAIALCNPAFSNQAQIGRKSIASKAAKVKGTRKGFAYTNPANNKNRNNKTWILRVKENPDIYDYAIKNHSRNKEFGSLRVYGFKS